MIQALLTVVLGVLVIGIIVALGVISGELLIMAESRVPMKYRTLLDYPVLFGVLVFGLICAWFMGQLTLELANAVASGALP
jgi:ABC-type sugar transport system permease subunit